LPRLPSDSCLPSGSSVSCSSPASGVPSLAPASASTNRPIDNGHGGIARRPSKTTRA
jgi:hypothetical protein